nr:hypothetical protein [Tanacetum cinerariifolium]
MKSKKKVVVITSDPLVLVTEKKVSKRKEKVVVSSESEGSDDDNFSELKKITALLAKAFNRKKFYAKPTNNNLRTSSATSSANKKQEYVKSDDKKEDKKVDEKKRDMCKVKCYNCKKEGHFAKDCKKTKEINASMVFMAQMEKILSDFKESSSSKDETIAEQASSLKPYVPNVILKKIIIDLEDEVVSFLDKEKVNLKIIESLKSKGFESSENKIFESKNQSDNDCQVVKKGHDNIENSNVIDPGLFMLNVSQNVSPISVSKTSCASNNVENKTKRKRRKKKTSNQNDNQVNNDVLRANRDFVHFLDLDTFSSVRRSKHSDVIWRKNGSSNTSKVTLSSVNHSNLSKNVKRYSRKDLLLCNNSHHKDTRSACVCNNARNASCNSRMNAYDDVNDLFVFDDVSLRKSHVSKMPFRKKSRDSLNVHSRRNLNKSLPRIVSKWLHKMQSLAVPIIQICLWIINSGCLKHMTGNCTLMTDFVEKFLGTVRFGNNDFAMIAGYEDVVIGSMTIKKAYYVKDLVTGDRSSNLYTNDLNEIASNSSNCLLAKASSSQLDPSQQLALYKIVRLFINVFDKTPYELINKRKPNLKFFRVFRCRCNLLNDYDDVGKLKAKGDIGVFVRYSKDSTAFRVYKKQTRKIHESVNVNFDEISEMASKQFSLEHGLSNLNETKKSLNPTVSQVTKTSKKDLEDLFHNFYDEYFDASTIKKSLTANVEISSNEGEVFHEVSESFQGESSSSSLNDDV